MKVLNSQKTITEAWSDKPNALSVSSIQDKYIRANTAKLLENQDRWVRKGMRLDEDFSMGVGGATGLNQGIPNGGPGKGVLPNISMAIVRRAFPEMFANILVGVQPMAGPVSLACAVRRIYKTADPTQIIEAAWKHVARFSGFTGSTANQSGKPDAGTAVETEAAEHWKLGGDPNKFEKWPELGLMLATQVVAAKTRKLGSSFSIESAQDVESMQHLDMMSEMIKSCQEELVQEVDRETIAHCKALCSPKVFKFKEGTLNGQSNGDNQGGFGDGWNGRWSQERLANIVAKVIAASNNIRTSTRQSAGNIAVVSPDIATAMQIAAPNFSKIVTNVNGSSATAAAGTLNGNIKVFIDNNAVDPMTNMDNGEVLLAYKGEGLSNCGVVYCPYITSMTLQATDPRDFSPRVGVMTRYAFADNMLGAENYYRLLRFEGLAARLGGDSDEGTW